MGLLGKTKDYDRDLSMVVCPRQVYLGGTGRQTLKIDYSRVVTSDVNHLLVLPVDFGAGLIAAVGLIICLPFLMK